MPPLPRIARALCLTVVAASPALAETHHFAEIDGLRIAWREAGHAAGPTVLLLHRAGTGLGAMRQAMAGLGDRFRVIAPDFPALCDSGTSATDCDRTETRARLAHLSRWVGGTRPAIAAADLNGQTCFLSGASHDIPVCGVPAAPRPTDPPD